MLRTTKSAKLFRAAQNVLVGGVNSPVRAFRSVGGTPLFIQKAQGAHVWDADGNRYVDFVSSWGPMILGHAHPGAISAVKRQIKKGFTYGAPTELESEMANLVRKTFPSIERVRFVSSGTEAVMSAIRAARGFTGRDKIVKFSGCYHGHSDSLLVKAGSGATTLGVPDSSGVPKVLLNETIVLPYNDVQSLKECFDHFGSLIAAVIVEPVAANMGLVPPKMEFLLETREATARSGTVLIFDEVVTGFRLALGGAQEIFKIRPDLTCLGKIIGGGMPVGAFGGRKEIMEQIAPIGPVYQAGTLSGNPVAMAAGIATLRSLMKEKPYKRLEKRASDLVESIRSNTGRLGHSLQINQMGSLFTIFFTGQAVTDYDSAKTANTGRFAQFHQRLLEEGIYFPPSQFETAFISTAHTDQVLRKADAGIRKALAGIV